MKAFKDLMRKERPREEELDEKTVFFLFERIIQRKYGERGREMISPVYLKKKTLGIKTRNPLWANELWLMKQEVQEELNREIGSEGVKEIKFFH